MQMIANFYAPEEIINVNNCIYVLLKILGQTMALTNPLNLDDQRMAQKNV